MARGSNSRDGRTARSEFPMGASDRGFASEGGSAGMPSPERIQSFYSPTSQAFIGYSKAKEHRQFARSVLQDAFASSEYAELGLPDSQYAMDALDAMQGMAERWAASGKAPTMAQTTEFREIAKQAVRSMTDELNQEAKAMAAEFQRVTEEYNRANGGGRAARSEMGGGTPTQPDGSPTKYPRMRESLRLLGAGLKTLGGKSTTQELALGQLNSSFGKVAYGVDLRDLPDSNELGDAVARITEKLDGFIKKPATATDAAIVKYHKSVQSAAKRLKGMMERDEL